MFKSYILVNIYIQNIILINNYKRTLLAISTLTVFPFFLKYVFLTVSNLLSMAKTKLISNLFILRYTANERFMKLINHSLLILSSINMYSSINNFFSNSVLIRLNFLSHLVFIVLFTLDKISSISKIFLC